MTTREKVHEIGTLRHRDRWYHANRRAVESLWQTKLKVDSDEVKDAIPLLLLRVLDGSMVDSGHTWDKATSKWVKLPEHKAAIQEEAEFCHGERICACGKKIDSIHSRQSKCSDCDGLEWKEKERRKEAERFEAATKIKVADYKGEHVYCGDKYYDSVEEAVGHFLEGQEPEYVWACQDKNLPTIDLEDVTTNLIDNMWDDADVSDLHGVEELEAALKAFNESNESIRLWKPDYSIAILVK